MNLKWIIVGISFALIAGLFLILGHNEHTLNVNFTDSQNLSSKLGNNNTASFSGILHLQNNSQTQGKSHVIVLYKDQVTSLHMSKINSLHGTVKKIGR